MASRTRRGGLGRPVDHSRRAFAAWALAGLWVLAVATGSVAAHGEAPILQVAFERVNPGGTLDLLGDMTTEGVVEIILAAPSGAITWSLGTAEADHEGHFRAFPVVPADLPAGDYRVRARMATEEATTRIVVAGPPVVEGGGRPGQDEALAGVPPDPGAAGVPPAAESPSLRPIRNPDPDLAVAATALAMGVGVAALLRLVARARSRRGADA